MSDKKECYVCEGKEPGAFAWRCEEHDICLGECQRKRVDIGVIPWGSFGGFTCNDCMVASIRKRIEEYQESDKSEYDLLHNNNIKCPYCGWEYEGEGDCEGKENCPTCECEIEIETEIEITYSTSKSEVNPDYADLFN